ncbi:MAG: PAS domain-containing protein [Acidobacteriota bacterium]|nr:MAG: PAS domain-containing protein [Acidobacteriota bacterium]
MRRTFEAYTSLLKNHFWKETDILYPMARRVLSADDNRAVLEGIEITEAALGPDTRARYYAMAQTICTTGGLEDLSKGLDPDVLAAMLNTLPVELSFVDAGDIVRYFSHENHDKIFPRTRGAIGVNVRECHPAKSLPLVERILEDFKAGRRDVAEFWIDFEGKRVHIRYWPVRGSSNEYLGCLETVQDITSIQTLTGERRLLDEA